MEQLSRNWLFLNETTIVLKHCIRSLAHFLQVSSRGEKVREEAVDEENCKRDNIWQ